MENFEQFNANVISRATVRILAFLNIVGAGMFGAEVEDNVNEMDPEAAAKVVLEVSQDNCRYQNSPFSARHMGGC